MHAFAVRRLARRVGLIVAAVLALAPATAGATTYSWSVPMSGQDVIASGLPAIASATGSASITADSSTNRICGTFSWSGVASPVVFGHIHQGGPGTIENPAVTINLFGPDLNGAPNPVTGCTTIPGPLFAELDRYSQEFNVVVHNKQFPGGAIRGQLGCNSLLFQWQCGGF
jgi:hypothetical protein